MHKKDNKNIINFLLYYLKYCMPFNKNKQMGNQNKSFKSLFYYYLLQERIHKVLNNDYSDIKGINTGYIIQENWIEEQKKINNYNDLYNTLKQLNITSESLSDSQKKNIEIKYKKIIFYKPYNPFIIENNFISFSIKIQSFQSKRSFI